ncbi:MAG: hypothetical protein ABR500_09590 [Dermatophilaceae bacterium]
MPLNVFAGGQVGVWQVERIEPVRGPSTTCSAAAVASSSGVNGVGVGVAVLVVGSLEMGAVVGAGVGSGSEQPPRSAASSTAVTAIAGAIRAVHLIDSNPGVYLQMHGRRSR